VRKAVHQCWNSRNARTSWLLVFLLASCLPSTANDLQSDIRSVTSSSSGLIRVEGGVRSVQVGDLLTPAESTALRQVVDSGRQTVLLNSAGVATGGTVLLNTMGTNAPVVIPQNVTVLANFSAVNTLQFNGALTNNGSLFAFTTLASNQTGTLAAQSIVNQVGGLISTDVPRALVPNAISDHFDLNLSARDSIVNLGTISSSGDLSLFSGSGHVRNAGSISSSAGSILVESATGHNLLVKGSGGQFQAGVINLRAPQGAIEANLGNVIGRVNLKAKDAHVFASTENLQLGVLDLSGDPTFYNATGSISVSNFAATPGVPLAIIASQDVVITGGNISTNAATAGDILIVAGANFLDPGAGNPLILSDVNPESATGGSIRVSGMNSISAKGTSGSGGNITLIAFDGSGVGSSFTPGTISVPHIESGGFGPTASGGDILIIAGADNGTAIQTVNITTAGGGTAAAGSISITAATPTILNGPITVNPDGSIAVGSGNYAPGATTNGGIEVWSLNSSGSGGVPGGTVNGSNASPITVTASGDIHVRNLLAFGGGGAGLMQPAGSPFQKAGNGGTGANITVTSTGGVLNVLGYVSSSGGGGGGGNGLFANNGGDGGDAGLIGLHGYNGVEVDHDIVAAGGGGGGNGGNGGDGNSIDLSSSNAFIDVHALVNNSGGGGGSAFAGATNGGAGGAAGPLISARAWTYAWFDAPVLSAGGGAGLAGGGGSFGGGGGGGGNSPYGGGGLGSGGHGDLIGGYGGGGSFAGGGGGGLAGTAASGGGAGIAGGGGAWFPGAGAGGSGIDGGDGGAVGIDIDDGGYLGHGGGPTPVIIGFPLPRYANTIVSNGGWGSGIVFGGTIGGDYTNGGGTGNGTFGDGGNGNGGANGEGVTLVGAAQIKITGNDIIAPRGYVALLENMHPRTVDPLNPSSSLRLAGSFNSASNWSTSLYGHTELTMPSPTTPLTGAGSYVGTLLKTVDPKCCAPSPPPPPPPSPPTTNPGGTPSNNPPIPPGLEVAAGNVPPFLRPLFEALIAANNNPSGTILPTDVTGLFGIPTDESSQPDHNLPTVPNQPPAETDIHVITPGLGTTTIDKGWALIAPSDSGSIKTPLCDVKIAPGAVVLLHVSNNRVSVYVMSDTKEGDVAVSSGDHQIALSVGQQVTIDKKGATTGDSKAPPGQIALRNVREDDLGNATVLLSDFSIPAALANGNLYKKLSKSTDPNDQALLDQMMKSAASVHNATAYKGPYR
jgi:hypothetical protein